MSLEGDVKLKESNNSDGNKLIMNSCFLVIKKMIYKLYFLC